MKKSLALLLAAVLVFGLTACSSNEPATTAAPTEAATTEARTEAPTKAPTEAQTTGAPAAEKTELTVCAPPEVILPLTGEGL